MDYATDPTFLGEPETTIDTRELIKKPFLVKNPRYGCVCPVLEMEYTRWETIGPSVDRYKWSSYNTRIWPNING